MAKSLRNRIIFIVTVLLVSIFGIIGVPKGGLKESIARNIHLGLDLRGGIHLVLQVQVAEAVSHGTDTDVARLEDDLTKAGITGTTVSKNDPAHLDTIQIAGVAPAKVGDVRGILSSNYANYDSVSNPDGSIKLTMKLAAVRDIETRALDQSIETIRQRIDSLGVSEPVIEKYGLGDNEILVELPGETDPAKVQDVIQSTARLEIHEVTGGPYATDQDALTANPQGVPPDSMLVHGIGAPGTGDQVWMLKRVSEVAGTDFRDAQPSQDENGRPDITFNLTTTAGDHFYKFTDAHKGYGVDGDCARQQACARSRASSRRSATPGRITGGFTAPTRRRTSPCCCGRELCRRRSSYLETRTVGPSLGAASIRQGVIAAIVGMLVVMAFMLIYYRGAGINADLALVLNLIILLGFMGYSACDVLTLPGIAGVILTIGMGVDSNVLIFERIREELRSGKTAAMAVQEGFKQALHTIIDTHVTTVVSAAILFVFGTGPVKGFAITLTFGLIANVFTAVLVSRVIFDAELKGKERNMALSI